MRQLIQFILFLTLYTLIIYGHNYEPTADTISPYDVGREDTLQTQTTGMTYHTVARYFEITKYEVARIHGRNAHRNRLGFDKGVTMGSKRTPYYNDEMQYGEMPTYTINELSNGEREYLHRVLPEGWVITNLKN